MESDRVAERARTGWNRFIERLRPEGPLPSVILESWQRSEAAGVERPPGNLQFHKVADHELQRRLELNADWLEIACPHLEWLSTTFRHIEYWNLALRTGEPYEIEYRFRRKDGQYRWFLGRALPVRDDSGRIVRWFGSCTDIEDIKRAENALRESEARYRRTNTATSRSISEFSGRRSSPTFRPWSLH